MLPARSAPPLRRALGVLLCCFAFLTVLGGGSTCTWSSNHHDDDDDEDDTNLTQEDDGSTLGGGHGALTPTADAIRRGLATRGKGTLLGAGSEAWQPGHDLVLAELDTGAARLTHFEVDLDPRPGHHPVSRLRDIRGLSVARLDELGVVGAEDFSAFTQAVLAENPALLGLPPAAGRLHPRSVHFLDEIIAVVHQQVRPGSPAGKPWAALLPGDEIPGSEMVFVFDLLGRLLQIENRTTLPPGVVVTLPEDLLATP
jgi:hypothetical protein